MLILLIIKKWKEYIYMFWIIGWEFFIYLFDLDSENRVRYFFSFFVSGCIAVFINYVNPVVEIVLIEYAWALLLCSMFHFTFLFLFFVSFLFFSFLFSSSLFRSFPRIECSLFDESFISTRSSLSCLSAEKRNFCFPFFFFLIKDKLICLRNNIPSFAPFFLSSSFIRWFFVNSARVRAFSFFV